MGALGARRLRSADQNNLGHKFLRHALETTGHAKEDAPQRNLPGDPRGSCLAGVASVRLARSSPAMDVTDVNGKRTHLQSTTDTMSGTCTVTARGNLPRCRRIGRAGRLGLSSRRRHRGQVCCPPTGHLAQLQAQPTRRPAHRHRGPTQRQLLAGHAAQARR